MAAPQVEIKSSMGTFVVELYINHAPKTCKNFIELSKRGYYDGTIVRYSKQISIL
jgi:peptidyl-prolyl cis-trans isomerase-like 1